MLSEKELDKRYNDPSWIWEAISIDGLHMYPTEIYTLNKSRRECENSYDEAMALKIGEAIRTDDALELGTLIMSYAKQYIEDAENRNYPDLPFEEVNPYV